MKKLLLILLIPVVASCTKDRGNCYNCTFGTSNGQQPPAIEYCGPMPHTFKDAQGNDLQSYCVPK